MSRKKTNVRKKIWTRPILSNLFFLFMGIIFIISLNTIKEIKNLDKKHKENMKNYELSRGNKSFKPSYLNKEELKKLSNKTIVIDPGHGGFDAGTSSKDNKLKEKDLNLKISQYLESYLKESGCKIVMTRTSDVAMEGATNENEDLAKRTEIINNSKGDLMVSIHINFSEDPTISGVNAYINSPSGYQRKERTELSKEILKSVSDSGYWKTGDVLEDKLYILKHSDMPSTLIECGFITNEGDKKKLQDDFYLQDLSARIGIGIIKYLQKKPK